MKRSVIIAGHVKTAAGARGGNRSRPVGRTRPNGGGRAGGAPGSGVSACPFCTPTGSDFPFGGVLSGCARSDRWPSDNGPRFVQNAARSWQ